MYVCHCKNDENKQNFEVLKPYSNKALKQSIYCCNRFDLSISEYSQGA